MMMVAAVLEPVSTAKPQTPKTQQEHSRRPPLVEPEKGYANGVAINQRKPKSRVVSSRYMSPSPSTSTSASNSSSSSSSSSNARRYPSPLISRSSTPAPNAPKRSVSVDRRRSAAARPLMSDLDSRSGNAAELSAARLTSTRSLSVSFQGEAFSLPISKTKAAPPSPNVRKVTPERRRGGTPLRGGGDQVENSKLSDHNRWPARNRGGNLLSQSLDCRGGGDRSKVVGSVNGIRTLQQLINDGTRASLDRRLSLDLGNSDLIKAAPDGNSVSNGVSLPCDLTASDSDSVSSDSTSGVQEFGGGVNGRNGPRGIARSARFWQETNSRLRRLQDPGSPLSMSPTSKLMVPPNLRSSSDGHGLSMSSPARGASPARGGIRPASPSKLMTPVRSSPSPSRGHSPSRIKNAVSTINNNFTESPSVLSFAVDVRRGKVGENRIFDAHLLRLLYNRNLQWRFVNATTEAVMSAQKHSAEKNLWNAWIAISDLRDTVTIKSHKLQLLRQKLRLASILKGQMTLLEEWASMEGDHSDSLLGAIESLKASTLRLPVVGGATANVLGLKDAIGSAFDVMHGMASSICLLLTVVEEVNTLVTELAQVTAKEQALLEQCTDLISSLAAMQVRDTSLRTHVIQHNFVRSA
ncbi:QWRF motif-containing protein 2-like isoform X1 [Salvia hispanica]|uniref:QWRF motif-containing protein 2-like isoform X1 n=1 Tax=Salvia hispanica TaxID=49212 RepID=UPI002009364B|nr:QWRF motif-containing protein 2-like isoform X1 [Salvia hispanica]